MRELAMAYVTTPAEGELFFTAEAPWARWCVKRRTIVLTYLYWFKWMQGRTDPGQTTGLVFQNCSVLGTLDYLALYQADPAGHQAFLGRPWKIFSRTIFIDTYLGQIIAPTGWLQWDGNYALATVFDGEIGSYGPGATNLQLRVNWSNQLTLQQAQAFSVNPFIQGASWLPQTGIPFNPWQVVSLSLYLSQSWLWVVGKSEIAVCKVEW